MSIKILLAEDDTDIQLIARLALRRAGFEVSVAGDGEQALAAVAASRPDAVLLDWMMPGVDGLEVCRRLKAAPETADLPIVFLTAKSQSSEIERGLALGAIGYITKPFDALTLGRDLHTILGK
jgi:DNA-binding response OmpR family regulator